MINEFDHVKIKSSGITGILVDKRKTENGVFCIVERDSDNELIDCTEDELERLD
ncbi:MAG: hypothetical protein KIC63_05850 [Clostridium sp.]|jgi:hypothetical protein|nr:hypothetical protein [Clostridium sp.]